MRKNRLITFVIMMIMGIGLINALSVTRTLPSSSTGNFQLTYQVDATGKWGVSIQDSVSGGCTFASGKTTYQDVILSDSGNTRTISITAPSSGSCTFTGDYKFGTDPIVTFSSQTVTIGSSGTGGTGNTGTDNTNTGTTKEFCIQFADNILNPYTNAGCQTNSILLIVMGVIIFVIIIAALK